MFGPDCAEGRAKDELRRLTRPLAAKEVVNRFAKVGVRESRYSPALVGDISAVILLTRVDIDARLRLTRSAEASSILDIAFALSETQAQLLEVLPRDASEGEVVRRRVERRLDLWFAWRVFEVARMSTT